MKLELKKVGDVEGSFRIEAYQRGYRWSDDEIKHLLEDINEVPDGQTYCLQPVVVKNIGIDDTTGKEIFELIDGQQRLTTLFLIMKYLVEYIDIKYSIDYVTRKSENGNVGSRELLEKITEIDTSSPSTNIDELFIKKAYFFIKNWFKDDKKTKMKFAAKLQDYVSVIWYEIDDEEDCVGVFTRLNIGKINLTNAELVKALFLCRKKDGENYTSNVAGIDDKMQHEIALEWDKMEKELHDDKFWSFITNEKAEKYPIRMEMLFDIIENKPSNESNYYTFNQFYEKFKQSGENKYTTWETVVRYFQQLQEWYKDFDLYHQIGFLVAQNESIKVLLDMALGEDKPMLKSEFRSKIVDMIREKMRFVKAKGTPNEEEIDYSDLNYLDNGSNIHTILLLFNVETIRQKGDENNRFPFERYKNQGTWSLEHIHAQNSESLKRNEDRRDWLTDHKKSLESVREELKNANVNENEKGKIKEIDNTIDKLNKVVSHIDAKNYDGSIREEFNTVSKDVINLLSVGDDTSQMHSLSNMALLTVGENAALSNSTFDVKRTRIIEMDKKGDYIPVCTRNVFMKYYSGSGTKLHFWSDSDRKSYIEAINDVLFRHKNENGDEIRLIKKEINYGKQ